ncbi:MAG: 50S ribosomal protein L35 [Myxococcales bacterium]|nr:50S ribosomal protein L35 [Myxococcales bacterium]
MPKMKTNKSAAKRQGHRKRAGSPIQAGGNHMLINKSRKRLRRLRNNDMVHGTMEKHQAPP